MSSAIDRRDFLHSAGASVAAFGMLRAASLVPSADSNERSGRLVYSLNRNWRFSSKRFENDTTLGFDSEFVSIYRASSATCGAIRPEPSPFPFKGQRNSSEKIPLASLEAAELYGSAQKSSPAKQHSALRPDPWNKNGGDHDHGSSMGARVEPRFTLAMAILGASVLEP